MTATLPLVRILVLLLMLVVLMPFLIPLQVLQVHLQRHCAPSGVDVQKYWGFLVIKEFQGIFKDKFITEFEYWLYRHN